MKVDLLWEELKNDFKGDWLIGRTDRLLYSTDASIYQELPLAVAIPHDSEDLIALCKLCFKHKIPLVPRGAGTSLAGQVVGNGIIVDTSKHFTRVRDFNPTDKTIWVEPGVIRDELNKEIESHQLLFGPETSTSNRCTIGGMIGNNSCGTRSIVYGSTRDQLLELKILTVSGELIHLKNLDQKALEKKLESDTLEGKIYKNLHDIINDEDITQAIKKNYPKASIARRNHGYALDYLLDTCLKKGNDQPLNLCKLFAGSEGTLGIILEAKLQLSDVLDPYKALLCIHCDTLEASLQANILAVDENPTASELMDHYILDCTKEQIEQKENRFFVVGEPKAILVVEFAEKSEKELQAKIDKLSNKLINDGLAYACPVVKGDDINRVWELRKAGLGLLSNIPGSAKPIAFIEDTAVSVADLPEYIKAFNQILKAKNLYAVHYAHAGSGELHLRPVIDLASAKGRKLFLEVAEEVADLVKSYKGSLSGEHGDGRLRGFFIPKMYGELISGAFKKLKECWDPYYLLNPNKIIDVPPIDSNLRVDYAQNINLLKTAYRYPQAKTLLAANSMCNGSGDCLKSKAFAGTMCPSYMATKKEKDSTRGRANILRNVLGGEKIDLNAPEVSEALKLCISCKACKRECPSNVDMAKYKSEVLYQQQKSRFDFFAYSTARLPALSRLPLFPTILNFTSPLAKKLLGIHPKRHLPNFKSYKESATIQKTKTWLFVDEFTRMERPEIIDKTINCLAYFGVEVNLLPIKDSARAAISVGQLDYAKRLVDKNRSSLLGLEIDCIIGIEPSAALSLKDEYPDLCKDELVTFAKEISSKTKSLERFLSELEVDKLEIGKDRPSVYIHTHCHQKALEGSAYLSKFLSNIGIRSTNLDSGCCGMAGSFGFKKENYEISRQIGENKLFPALKSIKRDDLVVGSGFSCKQRVKDFLAVKMLHPSELLWDHILNPKKV